MGFSRRRKVIRSCDIHVQLTEEERDKIEYLTKYKHTTMSRLIRDLVAREYDKIARICDENGVKLP